MEVVIDADVKAVMEFMQRSVAASKLLRVADGVGDLARLMWSRFETQEIALLRLEEPPISADGPHTQSASS